ncbi:MAG: glycoside hydrolase family 127 protein [Clostridia bacterium]|nr:glycoside hydrolase family 127 protein [Clostridia bacterium]
MSEIKLNYSGIAHETAMFLQTEHLMNKATWKKFAEQFRCQPDGENRGWRGEYWGKMMRGAVLVYSYTRDEKLFDVLTESVRDLLTVADADGRVSSYTRDTEFSGWDMWGRKYVILACEYYLEVCRDEKLKGEILAFITRCADYILSHVGPGKLKITKTSNFWFGINSSSILEPMVRLYRLTGEKRYLDFSKYIVDLGAAEGVNVFELAYENRLYPYQYGVSKAYELSSCFEGLLEYYEVTGEEKYKTAVVNYGKALLDSELSVIGGCGMTHELFDHTSARQTVKKGEREISHETCVTVTLMKLFSRLWKLTGESAFADAVEKSFYNAYLGTLNTEHCEVKAIFETDPQLDIVHTDLPFDSYSPLTPGKRGKAVGGTQILPDMSYYGCCACIGAAGVGVFLENAVSAEGDRVTVNFYERGEAELVCGGVPVKLTFDTDYPADGNVKIHVVTEAPAEFTLRLRNPGWADVPAGYAVYRKTWSDDTVELKLGMRLKFHYPDGLDEDVIFTDMSEKINGYWSGAPEKVYREASEDNYVAVTRGPLVLAADSRTGKAADSVFSTLKNGTLCENVITDGVPCLVKMRFTDDAGDEFYLVDYAHAGRDWETVIAAWLPVK